MAGANNAAFIANPKEYIRTHQLMISPQGIGSQGLQAGLMEIDLVSIDPHNAQFIRLENYAMRPPVRESKAVRAFFLPAINDNTSTLAIGVGGNYIFTADLSGCLFAAYGPSADNITVEHVNVRNPAQAVVPILPRAQAIIAANYAYYKILSPAAVPNADPNHVKVYAANSSVVGVKIGGAWNFYYKSSMTTVGLL
jgi:hypothetical protein